MARKIDNGVAYGVDNSNQSPVLPYGQRVFGSGQYVAYISNGTFTFTVPYGVVLLRVRISGAAGSGAVSVQSTGRWVAHGGATGGYSEKVFAVVPGATYTVTVGKGGASVTRNTVGVTVGIAGGTTSFGAVMTATGGAGGTANAVSNTPPALPGAGTGTGGDINFNGATTGQITFHSADSNGFATGGASASTWMGPGFASGDITSTNTSAQYASGGAGIGGRSGNVSGSVADTSSAGGGSGGASFAQTSGAAQAGGPDIFGVRPALDATGLPASAVPRFIGDVVGGSGGGVGASSGTPKAGGPGGGGAGSGNIGGAASPAGSGGVFGGGGGAADLDTSALAGSGGLAAGGGGAVVFGSTGTTPATSGAGGDGFCIVEW